MIKYKYRECDLESFTKHIIILLYINYSKKMIGLYLKKAILSRMLTIKTIFSNIFVYFIIFVLNTFSSPYTSNALIFTIEYIISPILIYITDIVFIQEDFRIDNKITQIPSDEFGNRFNYGLQLSIFYKYIVALMLSTIINKNIYEYCIKRLDKFEVMLPFRKRRNVVVGILVNVFATVVYVNALKFKWVYSNNTDINLNMIIVAWFSLTLLISTR